MKGLVIERTYAASPERIWQALTDHDKLNQWFFKLPDFKAEPGFEFRLADTNGKDKHQCRMPEVVPGKRLTYEFTNLHVAGDSRVSWELFGEGGGTRVKVTHSGLDTFPDTPGYQRKDYQGGWTYLVNSLAKYLGESSAA